MTSGEFAKLAAGLVMVASTWYFISHTRGTMITVDSFLTGTSVEEIEKRIAENEKLNSGPCEYVLAESTPIASIDRGNQTEGWFAFGFGGLSSDARYYAYEDLGNDSYKLMSVPAEGTEIRESVYERPAFNRYVKQGNCQGFRFDKYEMVVPKGAVRKNFQP